MKGMTRQIGLAKRLAIILFAFAVIMSATIGGIGYKTYMDTTFARHRELSVGILNLAMSLIDADDMRACLNSGVRSAAYERAQSRFNMIKESMEIAYLYLFDLTPEGRVVYYLNALTDGERKALEARGEPVHSLGYEEAYPEEAARELLEIKERAAPYADIVERTQYGYMLSMYSPMKNSRGEVAGLLGVDVDMDDIKGELTSYASTVAAGAAVIALSFVAALILFIRRNVTEPIRVIAEKSSEFANKDIEDGDLLPIELNIRTRDEIEVLASSFEKMTRDLARYVSDLTRATAAKERIEGELMVARSIQSGILPSIFPPFPDRDEFDIYAYMTPAKEVGGDFYDFFMTDDSHVAIVIADVSGKGVPAALMMMVARTLIKNEALSDEEPGDILARVNERLCEGNSVCMFVTSFLGIYDIGTGVLKYANAGHNPPILAHSAGNADFLPCARSLVLAVMEGTDYESQETRLDPGDNILLYTDGVTEAFNGEGEAFSEQRLLNVANLSHAWEGPREIIELVSDELDKFVEGTEQSDDITMIALARLL
ncbi:MAG: SpoIIE family protein phosphatase [Synergistaceae bacterium]|jgi:sigma-B regulation protein RsbU (phosphoserine phosphatase)|nr:SpoIIE family protein phosphatase [Synergistaceae bacterium]